MAELIKKTDVQIQQEVSQELQWNPRVTASEIGVIVKNGIVTLTGWVDSWAKRIAAEEAAHRVAGVLDVANEIRVKPPTSLEKTDTDIAQAVRRALEWNVLVPANQIQTTVSNGIVTLSCTVRYWYERDEAERAVRNLPGVIGVINNIVVAPAAISSDQIKKTIEEALERHVHKEAQQISVSVSADGTVTLKGSVHSWSEKQAILEAARNTPGVRNIQDKIYIIS